MDPLALIVSSSVIDLEPFFVLFFGLRQPVHGFWHSYFGVLLLAVLLTLGVHVVELRAARVVEIGWRMLRIDRVRVRYPLKVVFYSNVIGGFSHVFFDMFTHRSFPYVLYPVVRFSNPAWMGIEAALVVEAFVVLLSVYSCWLWLKSFLRKGSTREVSLTAL